MILYLNQEYVPSAVSTPSLTFAEDETIVSAMESEAESCEGGESGQVEQILYDIVTYKEWEQEPELVRPSVAGVGRPGWLGASTSPALPPTLERLGEAGLPWHLAVSQDAQLIAVLGDTTLEVWSSKESYSQLVGRRAVERDCAPQWRHLAWSPDCSVLAVAASSGAVELCDTAGGPLFSLVSPALPASQPGWADSPARAGPCTSTFAGLFLLSARARDQWAAELLLVDYSGRVNSFLVSGSGYQEVGRYSLGWQVTAAALCPGPAGLLLLAGGADCPLLGSRRLPGRASHAGLVALRRTDTQPHFIPLLDGEEKAVAEGRAWLPWLSRPPVQVNLYQTFGY